LLDEYSTRSSFSDRARELARENAIEAFARKVREIYAWVLAAKYQSASESHRSTTE